MDLIGAYECGYVEFKISCQCIQIDIFALDKVLGPIHLGNHWCLAVINFQDKRFEYYDSLGGENKKCLEVNAQHFFFFFLRDNH